MASLRETLKSVKDISHLLKVCRYHYCIYHIFLAFLSPLAIRTFEVNGADKFSMVYMLIVKLLVEIVLSEPFLPRKRTWVYCVPCCSCMPIL